MIVRSFTCPSRWPLREPRRAAVHRTTALRRKLFDQAQVAFLDRPLGPALHVWKSPAVMGSATTQ